MAFVGYVSKRNDKWMKHVSYDVMINILLHSNLIEHCTYCTQFVFRFILNCNHQTWKYFDLTRYFHVWWLQWRHNGWGAWGGFCPPPSEALLHPHLPRPGQIAKISHFWHLKKKFAPSDKHFPPQYPQNLVPPLDGWFVAVITDSS